MTRREPDSEEPLFSDPALSQLSATAKKVYEDARVSSLCHEGAWEIAWSLMRREEAPQSTGDSGLKAESE